LRIENIHLPPLLDPSSVPHALPSAMCRVHRTGIHLLSKGSPPSSSPLLKLTLYSFHLFLGPFASPLFFSNTLLPYEREASYETSIAEENTNLILHVIHLGNRRSGLSPIICIFMSIYPVLIAHIPRVCISA